jgi:hypothetical protein
MEIHVLISWRIAGRDTSSFALSWFFWLLDLVSWSWETLYMKDVICKLRRLHKVIYHYWKLKPDLVTKIKTTLHWQIKIFSKWSNLSSVLIAASLWDQNG